MQTFHELPFASCVGIIWSFCYMIPLNFLEFIENCYAQFRKIVFASCVGILWSFCNMLPLTHDDVIKWKHFPRNWPFVREIHRSPVNFPHKGQSRGALMFSLIYAWINDWVNNREAGDLRRQHGHYDVIVMCLLNGYMMMFQWLSVTNVIPTSLI